MNKAEKVVRELLARAGITIDGPNDYDIQINDPSFYTRVLTDGVTGFGETYMDGLWDCEALETLTEKLLRADLERVVQPLKFIVPYVWARIANRQRRSKAFDIGKQHYDIGNELYRNMLDKRMTYTCGYWKDAADLDSAQEAKLDLTCRKIGLQPGMRVLDIGCGWGSFARFAAEKYGASVVGVTVSQEQIDLGREMCEGLDVELRYQDYRDVNGQFDRVVSLGMFEHVGRKNHRRFMKTVRRCLTDDGLFLLHTIGTNHPKTAIDSWTDKYIFPGGQLPTPKEIAAAYQDLFIAEDWHNFRRHYTETLLAWMRNVDANWERIAEAGYDQRFYRMWRFFLRSSAGSFLAARNQLWQIVFSLQGLREGYESVR